MKVFGVIGWKNSGKTSLVARLVTHFSARGLRVSTLKHAHCGFDIDQPGSDSDDHRRAGASEVLVTSGRRWALMHELANGEDEPDLAMLLGKLASADLVLVEGFKYSQHPKIQTLRPAFSSEAMPAEIEHICALASDEPVRPQDYGRDCPVLDLNDTEAIAQFIAEQLGISFH